MIAGSVLIDSEAVGAVIDRAIAGDENAFAEIVAAHHGDMARIAYLVSGSSSSRTTPSRPPGRSPGAASGPSRPVAASSLADVGRGERGPSDGPERPPPDGPRAGHRRPDELAGPGPRRHDRPRQRPGQLDPKDRILIGLRFVAGLESAAIGREVGMTASGVRVRLHRLMARFRKELGDD